jgi:hypothetical protein
MFLGFALVFSRLFGSGEPFEKHRGELQINSSELKFGTDTGRGPTVAVLGTFRNTGQFSWKDINVEIRFLGPDGKLFDGGQQLQFGLEAPAHGEVAFKVSIRRAYPQESYKNYKIAILSARDQRSAWP